MDHLRDHALVGGCIAAALLVLLLGYLVLAETVLDILAMASRELPSAFSMSLFASTPLPRYLFASLGIVATAGLLAAREIEPRGRLVIAGCILLAVIFGNMTNEADPTTRIRSRDGIGFVPTREGVMLQASMGLSDPEKVLRPLVAKRLVRGLPAVVLGTYALLQGLAALKLTRRGVPPT